MQPCMCATRIYSPWFSLWNRAQVFFFLRILKWSFSVAPKEYFTLHECNLICHPDFLYEIGPRPFLLEDFGMVIFSCTPKNILWTDSHQQRLTTLRWQEEGNLNRTVLLLCSELRYGAMAFWRRRVTEEKKLGMWLIHLINPVQASSINLTSNWVTMAATTSNHGHPGLPRQALQGSFWALSTIDPDGFPPFLSLL